MTYCGEMTIVKSRGDHLAATTLRCRSWTCPECVDGRKAQLIAQAHRGHANTFITLTVRRDSYADPTLAAKALANAWRIIVKRAGRERDRDRTKNPYPFGANDGNHWDLNGRSSWPNQVRFKGKSLQYLAVIESHKSGWPHLHILVRSEWIDQDWLAEQTKELLDAHRVDVERITKKSQVNAYVAKYCGKCTHKFGTTKRYWQTASYQITKYQKPASKEPPWWDMWHARQSIFSLRESWISMGYHVESTSWWHCEAWRVKPPDRKSEDATASVLT